jgi:hypothetical protein
MRWWCDGLEQDHTIKNRGSGGTSSLYLVLPDSKPSEAGAIHFCHEKYGSLLLGIHLTFYFPRHWVGSLEAKSSDWRPLRDFRISGVPTKRRCRTDELRTGYSCPHLPPLARVGLPHEINRSCPQHQLATCVFIAGGHGDQHEFGREEVLVLLQNLSQTRASRQASESPHGGEAVWLQCL